MHVKTGSATLLMAFLLWFQSNSQSEYPKCLTDHLMEQYFIEHPDHRVEHEQKAKWVRATKNSRSSSVVVTIPVHFIIVHAPGDPIGTGENLSNEHILSQLDVMNQDFRRLNPDASNTPPEFAAADSEIEFCLASIDPQGNDTDGITRFATDLDFSTNETSIKQQTGWPRETYLNIWVATGIGVLGYAYVPSINFLPNPTLDGVVCATHAFGGPGFATNPVYNLGRTVTHEIGHYLGLGHVWAGDGCDQDDGFDDTPIQDDENFGCPTHPSPSCSNGGDMFMNYMDYSNDACLNAFTVDQNTYMHLILNNSRSSLLTAASIVCSLGPEPLSASVTTFDVSCNGESTGGVIIDAIGGIPPYLYSIDNANFQSESDFMELAAGDYTAYVEDSDAMTFQVEFTISEPGLISINIEELIAPTCFGGMDGSLTLEVTGGTEPYGFISVNGMEAFNQEPIDQLSAGLYFIEVEDANGCLTSIDVEISNPEELIAEIISIQGIGCQGEPGSIQGGASGGTGEVLYSLDGITFFDQSLFLDLSEGEYIFYVKDDVDCTAQTSFEIEPYVTLQLEVHELNDVLCNGESNGSVTLSSSGGSSPYTFSIDNIIQPNGTFNELAAGGYVARVVDQNGCTDSLIISIEQPEALTISATATPVTCPGANDGTIEVNVTGGTPPYSFAINENPIGSGSNIQEQPPGTYTIVVSDSNGCLDTTQVEISSPTAIEMQLSLIQNVSCFGAADGQVVLDASGGNGNFEYSLNQLFYQPDPQFTFLDPGQYEAFARDASGCIQSISFEILEPQQLAVDNAIISHVSCYGEASGGITFGINGGSGQKRAFIGNVQLNEQNGFSILGLPADTFSIDILDENDCQINYEVIILQPGPMTFDVIDISGDNGSGNGSVQIKVFGGTPPYETDGGNFQENEPVTISGLSAGDYVISVFDANGCIISISVEIPLNTSTKQSEDLSGIQLYPNPANRSVVIEWDVPAIKEFELLEISGKQLLFATTFPHSGKHEMEISQFQNGIYILKLQMDTGQFLSRKFIIQHE